MINGVSKLIVHVIKVPKQEERENGTGAEYRQCLRVFPELIKDGTPQIWDSQQSPGRK